MLTLCVDRNFFSFKINIFLKTKNLDSTSELLLAKTNLNC